MNLRWSTIYDDMTLLLVYFVGSWSDLCLSRWGGVKEVDITALDLANFSGR